LQTGNWVMGQFSSHRHTDKTRQLQFCLVRVSGVKLA